MKNYKIVGVMITVLAILFGSAIPSYAWQPRTRLGERIQARGGILSKISAVRTSCGSAAAVSCGAAVKSCGGSAASFGVAATSCSGSLSCAGSTTTYVGSAPTPVSTESTPVSTEPVFLSTPPVSTDLVFLSAPDCSSGQCTPVRNTVSAVARSAKGSLEFATRLAREGRMYHDRSYIGYENVASGASSPEDAVRMWQNSPPHRRNLPYITDIQCVNGFCVGR